jgi:hypothetical protein
MTVFTVGLTVRAFREFVDITRFGIEPNGADPHTTAAPRVQLKR